MGFFVFLSGITGHSIKALALTIALAMPDF